MLLQNLLPEAVISNREIMFGYQLRLLIEDLSKLITERVSLVFEDMHREVIVEVAMRHGFIVMFSPVHPMLGEGRIFVSCERTSNVSFF